MQRPQEAPLHCGTCPLLLRRLAALPIRVYAPLPDWPPHPYKALSPHCPSSLNLSFLALTPREPYVSPASYAVLSQFPQ